MGDDLGDVKFSDSFRKRLEIDLDTFWTTLKQINNIRREARYRAQIVIEQKENEKRIQQEQNDRYKTAGKTSGGAIAGAGIGAIIGGPPGAAIGFLLGGIFGFNM